MLAQQFPPRGPVGGTVKRFVLRPAEVVGLSASRSNVPVSRFVDARGREEAGAELGSAEEVVGPSAARKGVPVSRFVDARGREKAGTELGSAEEVVGPSAARKDVPASDSSMQEAARRQSQRCPQPLPVAPGALFPPPAHPCGSSAIAITPKRSKEILEFRTRAIGLLCQFILQIDRFVLGDWRGAPCTISRNSNSNQLQLWNHSPGCQTSYLSLNITAFNLGAFSLARDLTAHWHSDLYEEQCCAGERLCCRRDRQQGRVAAALEA